MSASARIAIDARKLGDLGIGTYLDGILGELGKIASSHKYILYCAPASRPPVSAENFEIVPVADPKYSVRELVTLPVRLLKTRADLFHSPHYVVPPIRHCPTVVTIHDVIHLRFPHCLSSRLALCYAWLMLWIATRTSRRIITVSQHSKRDIVQRLRVPETKIQVIYNGLGHGFVPILDPLRLERTRQMLGLPRRFCLYVGNLNPHKNVLRLLEAFRIVAGHDPEIELCIVGESQRRDAKVEAIRRAIAAEPRVRKIDFLPYQSLPDLYSLAQVYVHPSLYEGFGLTPLEAMACGTPVAAAKTSSLPEVLGDAALWFDPTSPAEMADAMIRLLEDRPQRECLIQRGLSQVKHFSWKEAARETFLVYKAALNQA